VQVQVVAQTRMDAVLQGTKLHFKSPTAERRHVLWRGSNPHRPLRRNRVSPPSPTRLGMCYIPQWQFHTCQLGMCYILSRTAVTAVLHSQQNRLSCSASGREAKLIPQQADLGICPDGSPITVSSADDVLCSASALLDEQIMIPAV
jgi:hypothetical protein